MAKACPLCDSVAEDDAAWRHHLIKSHEWDPSGEPTYVGDLLVAVGFGFVIFLSLMMGSLCSSGGSQPRGCDALNLWLLAGGGSLLAGIIVVTLRPIQRIRRRDWIASGRASVAHRERRMSPTERARLRRIDATASSVILAAFGGVFAAGYQAQQDTVRYALWAGVAFVCLVVVFVAALIRARIRKRILT